MLKMRFYVFAFSLALIAAPWMQPAHAKCSGASWTYKPSAGKNNMNAIGCKCMENNKNYKISWRGGGSKNLFNGNKTQCTFPKYSVCGQAGQTVGSIFGAVFSLGISLSFRDGEWSDCAGRWIVSGPSKTIDSLPVGAWAMATDDGWQWGCNKGLTPSSDGTKCVCPEGKVVKGETCVTPAECVATAGFDMSVDKLSCIKSNWCNDGDKTKFNGEIHVQQETKVGDRTCNVFRCQTGHCFKSYEDKSCLILEGAGDFGGMYIDSTDGTCKQCAKDKVASADSKSCRAPGGSFGMTELRRCWMCNKSAEMFTACLKSKVEPKNIDDCPAVPDNIDGVVYAGPILDRNMAASIDISGLGISGLTAPPDPAKTACEAKGDVWKNNACVPKAQADCESAGNEWRDGKTCYIKPENQKAACEKGGHIWTEGSGCKTKDGISVIFNSRR